MRVRARHDELARAQAALAQGKLKRAIRHAWRAALRARHERDEATLEAVVALAGELRAQATGGAEREAESAGIYAARCLDDVRSGVERGSPLVRLFGRPPQDGVKRCPDCAETVKAEARVCRFCGHRFAEPPAAG